MGYQKSAAHHAPLIELVNLIAVFSCCRALSSDFVKAAWYGSKFFVSLVYFSPIEPRDHVSILHTLQLVALLWGQSSKSLLQT